MPPRATCGPMAYASRDTIGSAASSASNRADEAGRVVSAVASESCRRARAPGRGATVSVTTRVQSWAAGLLFTGRPGGDGVGALVSSLGHLAPPYGHSPPGCTETVTVSTPGLAATVRSGAHGADVTHPPVAVAV